MTGYPVAAVAFYGATDKNATKVVVAIFAHKGAEPEPMRKWYAQADARNDPELLEEVLGFIRSHEARSVGMMDRIIGCPHEEGTDYPKRRVLPELSVPEEQRSLVGRDAALNSDVW